MRAPDDGPTPALAAALDYAANFGWKSFPARTEGGKKWSFLSAEYAPGGENWGMTNDPKQLTANFNNRKWRDKAGVGVPTGPVNGIFVVEADTEKGHDVDGIGSLRNLEAEHSALPKTRMAESPSGSVHYYFKWPTNRTILNSTSKIAPGVDVRGEGGMVVAPPSVRSDGAYRWLNETPIADAPEWLIDLATRGDAEAPPLRPVPEFLKGLGGIGKSTDPSDCYSREAEAEKIMAAMAVIPNDDVSQNEYNKIGMACWAATNGSDEGFAAFDLWARKSKKKYHGGTYERWANYNKYPPTRIGAGSIFHWADKADPNWRMNIEAEQNKTEKPPPSTIGTEPSKSEPIPVDLWAKFDPPPLPIGLLPKVIEDFALEQSELIGADPSGLAMAALAVSAAALPDYVKLQPKKHDPNWVESARIWIALIGLPSTKKTPTISRAAHPIIRIDGEMMRKYLKAKAEYERLPPDQRKATEPPKQTRLRIEDATIEGARDVLVNNPNGVLMLRDEMAGWFGSIDKYAGHRGAAMDRGFWLQTYNGGPYAVDRATKGPAYIENLSLCLLGGIQPEPLRKIANDTVDDGLLQRLLPIVLRPGTKSKDEPNGRATEQYEAMIERLLKMEEPFSHLRFDEGAMAIRERLESRHLELMNLESINKKLAAHIGKYDGLFVRLCLLWFCIEGAKGYRVTEQIANRVAAFLHQFLLPHAIAFYAGTLGLSDDHDRLAAVAGYILARKLEWITNRDVQRGDRTMRGLKRNEIENIFHQLDALGWVERVPGRRLSDPPRWAVNEEVHRRFADRAVKEAERRATERAMIVGLLGGAKARSDDD